MVDSGHAANRSHCSGGMVFYVLNRANARARIFAKEADYAGFERVMKELEAVQRWLQRDRPFGSTIWQAMTVQKLALESIFQPRARPRKAIPFSPPFLPPK